MAEPKAAHGSWWQTVPGMLTAAAGLITATTGLLIALNQVGAFSRDDTRSRAGASEPIPESSNTDSRSPSARPAGSVGVDESAASSRAGSVTLPASASPINLLSPQDGGQLLLAPNNEWSVANDGKENDYQGLKVGEEAVFGFRNERPATFDRFRILIPGKGRNPKELDLEASDESPTGPFRPVATLHPQDVRVMKTAGWQEFTFPPVTAKYLKVRLRSNHEDVVWIHLYELQLMGKLQ